MTEGESTGRHQPATAVHAAERPWELLPVTGAEGSTTGGRPICEGRFNMTARKRIEEEYVEV